MIFSIHKNADDSAKREMNFRLLQWSCDDVLGMINNQEVGIMYKYTNNGIFEINIILQSNPILHGMPKSA